MVQECINRNRSNVWKNLSDEQKMERLKRTFDKHVIRQEGCWDWNGFMRPDGYVRIRFGERGKSIGGHVASYMIYHNVLDLGKDCVLHICDNRKCTNPDHLYLGSHRDNSIDMVYRKRHPVIKLTPTDVKVIKNMLKNKISCTDISKIYKVHRGTINEIKLGKTWSHVGDLSDIPKKNPNKKLLTKEEAREIKRMLENGNSIIDIANQLNLNWRTVSNIKRGKTWKHVQI